MTSRERLQCALNHEPADRVCVDFGSTAVTGIAASAVARLRRAVLGEEDYRVKVIEPYQMLGEIDADLREALGIDVVGATPPRTLFGFENADWKPFTLFDGTEVLVPGLFNVTRAPDGGWYLYPEGDTTVPPSGHMPKNGFYFDAICRQDPVEDSRLDPTDNLEEFGPLSESDIEALAIQARRARESDLGVVLSVPGAGFGDIALVPAMWLKHPRGIRDVEEWYVSLVTRREYIRKVFDRQCEIALENIARLVNALDGLVQVAFLTGTDFGTQRGLFASVDSYRDLFKPFHQRINDFVHGHSTWRTFIHSCGSVRELIPDFINAGFDVLNPVQCSAAGMDAAQLKREYGNDLVFWGGGVDTQRTLPFGTPQQVYEEVRERIQVLGEGAGFVFNTIHNIQATTPVENMLALFRAIRDSAASHG